MRNAALILGLIGGIVGMIVGFFYYGFAILGEWWGELTVAVEDAGIDAGKVLDDPQTAKVIALAAPIGAIAGAALAPSRPAVAMVLLGASAAGMVYGFTFNLFTMFPIAMTGMAALFAALGAVMPPKPAHH